MWVLKNQLIRRISMWSRNERYPYEWHGKSSWRYLQTIATIAATQNSSTLSFFAQLLYSALNAIQPASFVTSADRSRISSLTGPQQMRRTILVGDGLAKGWNAHLLDHVGEKERKNHRVMQCYLWWMCVMHHSRQVTMRRYEEWCWGFVVRLYSCAKQKTMWVMLHMSVCFKNGEPFCSIGLMDSLLECHWLLSESIMLWFILNNLTAIWQFLAPISVAWHVI